MVISTPEPCAVTTTRKRMNRVEDVDEEHLCCCEERRPKLGILLHCPVHKLVCCSLPMTLSSATSHDDVAGEVVSSVGDTGTRMV